MKFRNWIAFLLLFGLLASEAQAAWVWTPETRRWINPKYAAKDSPSAQMEWAMSFFEGRDYARASKEFHRLVRTYPRSELAPEAQYLLGVSYELMDLPSLAFNAFKKVVEVYPFSNRFKDSVEREYLLAGAFASGKKIKIIGPVKFPSMQKAIEVYQHVVDHAPYGAFGDKAQFQLGELFLSLGRLEEATRAFQRVVDEYPASDLVESSEFKIAICAQRLSLEPSYDQSATTEAIEWYGQFIETHPDSELVPDASESLIRLHDIKAQGLINIAQFYEKQRKPEAAKIYYQDVLNTYPNTPSAAQALAKLTEFEQDGSLKE